MKQVYLWAALFSVCVLAGCGGKKTDVAAEERQIYQIDSVDVQTGVQRMQESHVNQNFSCNGKKYKLSLDRVPDSSLPAVKSDMGTFADNRIRIKIQHENGSPLFDKAFTKEDFAPYLPANFLANSILEGMVFDDVKTAANKEITLAASVSYPMTDLYVPFTIVVSQSGKMTLAKDEDMGELTPLEE